MNLAQYRTHFRALNGLEPYEFQVRTAEVLAARENVLLRAPTGAGKTLTVLTPFLFSGWAPRPTRLIYAVPLRTLAQGIYAEARRVTRAGEGGPGGVTMQTGEQPDDPYFTRGRVIVTTYDQVLSGLLSGPYGQSPRLHNINSAAMAGALVVFDEFHLMEPQRAFLTGVAGLHLFRGLAQCVWMTATATSALSNVLAEALGAVDTSPSREEVARLPSVASTERRVSFVRRTLDARSVLESSAGRTLIICNTVARAQALYADLRRALPRDVPVLLLHSRFFKRHREDKVRRLRALFGKGSTGRAFLIATQVVEAGFDISCDDLHTELCPMNSLIQRAGRCARFAGEAGWVYVYALPDEERAWLPYGDLHAPDPALGATESALAGLGDEVRIDPQACQHWVEAVHASSDRLALHEGWRGRHDAVVQLIRQNSIDRRPQRIANLIREESTDEVQVQVCTREDLPERPGQRESITVSRWQLRRVFDVGVPEGAPRGWYWSFGDRLHPSHWEPLQSVDELVGKPIICLSPAVARYTRESGLLVGQPGRAVSPPRREAKRPGYRPLRRESWAHHALMVARQSVLQARRDGVPGWLAEGCAQRYGLSSEELVQALRITGLLHDLGKLQRPWQGWAEAWQRSREPGYRHTSGLAHTDFDPDSAADRAAQRSFRPPRPPHAAASAYGAMPLLRTLLATVSAERLPALASACLGAITAHHGAWLPSEPGLRIAEFWDLWESDLRAADVADPRGAAMARHFSEADRRRRLNPVLEQTVGPDQLPEWWPLVAYFMRTLRLSDQRATSEGTADE